MKKLLPLHLLVVAIILLCALPGWGTLPVDAHNLLRNGDLEEGDMPPAGWTPQLTSSAEYELTDDALSGKYALKISLRTHGSAAIVSDACPVTAGTAYLLTFWYHAEGMSSKGSNYDGCTSGMHLLWEDAGGKIIGRSLCTLPYGPVADYRAATLATIAPVGAVRVQCRLEVNVDRGYHGPPTVVFLDQVRLARLAPPVLPATPRKWEYLNRQNGSGLQIVADRDAARGEAALAEVGKAAMNAGLTWGQYTSEQPVGDYLAIFRLKVKDNSKPLPVAMLNVTSFGNLSNRLAESKTLLATDFRQPGVYQEFAVRFIRPEEGILEFTVSFLENTDLWFDKTTVVQLAAFPTDKEQAAIWLGE